MGILESLGRGAAWRTTRGLKASELPAFIEDVREFLISATQVSSPKPVGFGFRAVEESKALAKANEVFDYVRHVQKCETMSDDEMDYLRSLSMFERGVLAHYAVEDLRDWIMGCDCAIPGFCVRRWNSSERSDNIKFGDEEYALFRYFLAPSTLEKHQLYVRLTEGQRELVDILGIDVCIAIGEWPPLEILEEVRRLIRKGADAARTTSPRVETREDIIAQRMDIFAASDAAFEKGDWKAGFQLAREGIKTSDS